MRVEGTLGLLAPDPRQRAAWPSGLPFGGIRLGWRPGSQRARRACRGHGAHTGAPRRGACGAPPIRHGNCRDTFPSEEGGWVGRARAGLPYGRPASREGCALRLSRERRRPPAEADGGYSGSSGHAPMRRTAPFPTCPSTPADKLRHARQAHHLARNEGGPPVPPGRQRTTGTTPNAVPSRPREEANSLAQQEAPPPSQAARGPGAAMVLSRFGCHRSPFGSFPREGKNASHARATGKRPSRHQAQPKAHHPASNEGGPPVPPGRQRTTGTTPQAAPSRPREEAYSLAPHEVSPSTQARRGPGAAMVLSRIGCHRSPFGSFPREGKNASHIGRCAREPRAIRRSQKPPPPARSEGGPPVPPGRQRTTGITPKVAPSRPREEGISLAPHAVPPSSQARRGPGAAMVLSRIGCHRAPFGSFPREGKNSLPHPQMCKGTSPPRQEKEHPSPAPRAKGSRPPHLEKRFRPPPRAKAPRAGSGAQPLRRNRRPASKSPAPRRRQGPPCATPCGGG